MWRRSEGRQFQLVKSVSVNMGGAKCPCVCRRRQLSGRGDRRGGTPQVGTHNRQKHVPQLLGNRHVDCNTSNQSLPDLSMDEKSRSHAARSIRHTSLWQAQRVSLTTIRRYQPWMLFSCVCHGKTSKLPLPHPSHSETEGGRDEACCPLEFLPASL